MHKVSLYTTSKAAWFDAVKHNVGVGITFESFMWEESLYKDMFNDIAVLEITEHQTRYKFPVKNTLI